MLHDRGLSAKIILGGDGPEKSALEKLAADLDINDSVTFSGWVDDVPDFLAQGPIFVLPSLDEPFGIVVLEAMAQGKIIVSTRSQGPREILDDTTAYLCPTDDPTALADALQLAWNGFDE